MGDARNEEFSGFDSFIEFFIGFFELEEGAFKSFIDRIEFMVVFRKAIVSFSGFFYKFEEFFWRYAWSIVD